MKKISSFFQLTLVAILTCFSINNQAQVVTDYDGNTYNTVTIGTQIWMKEYLRVKHFLNGDFIPNITNDSIWYNQTIPARCFYNNDSSIIEQQSVLYNWYAVNDSRKLCPTGLHVPSNSEWNKLEIYLDSSVDTTSTGYLGIDIGGKLKETGFSHWSPPNTGATNSSGFRALPGGYRYGGVYYGLGSTAMYWTSTAQDPSNIWRRDIYMNSAQIYTDFITKDAGLSVRCIMDSLYTQINENNINIDIDIYPNPTIDKIYIKCIQKENVEIQIYNSLGEIILQKEINNIMNSIDINLLPKGIYVVKLKYENLAFFKKLIKN